MRPKNCVRELGIEEKKKRKGKGPFDIFKDFVSVTNSKNPKWKKISPAVA